MLREVNPTIPLSDEQLQSNDLRWLLESFSLPREPETVAFRVITIPNTPPFREWRIKQILRTGTDRTNALYDSPLNMFSIKGLRTTGLQYREVAKETKLLALDLFCATPGDEFQTYVQNNTLSGTLELFTMVMP